ncbi:MAG: hypothetical protein Q8936_14350 [Bacillota bacterium]|nr:hypothetical protein [Bacillota bacterium]
MIRIKPRLIILISVIFLILSIVINNTPIAGDSFVSITIGYTLSFVLLLAALILSIMKFLEQRKNGLVINMRKRILIWVAYIFLGSFSFWGAIVTSILINA